MSFAYDPYKKKKVLRIKSRAERLREFYEESRRQAIEIAKIRSKRKKDKFKTRPTFKEAGKKIKRVSQDAFGFDIHPLNF